MRAKGPEGIYRKNVFADSLLLVTTALEKLLDARFVWKIGL